MGFLSKLKYHAKRLIVKQVDVAEEVANHVEKEEKKITSTPKKYTNLRQKKQKLKQGDSSKKLKRNKEDK